MRRPVVCFSAMFGLGICMAFIMDLPMSAIIISVTVSLIVVVLAYLNRAQSYMKNGVLLICVMMLGGLWFGLCDLRIDPISQQAGNDVRIQGIVTEADFEADSCSLVVRTNQAKTLVKFYGNCEHLKNCKGTTVDVCGVAELPQTRRNPGCFDYRLYLKTCGIHTIIRAESIKTVAGSEIPYLKLTGSIRNTFMKKTEQYVEPSVQGMIMAIMFGDKTMLDEDVYSEFQKNGTAHVLAVSGLHTGIIYAFFVFLWKWKKGSLFYITVSVMLLFYMSLADFSPSVVRASFMIFIHLLAELLRCRYDLLTAAGLTFAVMLAWNPYQLFNTGFQLSFLAVTSLAVIIPFVKKFYQGIFLSAIAIQGGMVPYTAYVFNYISIGSILANIPVIFIAGIMLPVGICALASMFIPGELFGFLIKMMEICCDVMIGINEFFYVSGKTSFDVISPPVWLLIVYYGALFSLLSETGQLMIVRRQVRRIAVVATAICLTALLSVLVMSEPFDEAGIVFVDVGQGDCIHIRTPSGKNYLVDGGGDTDYDVGVKTLKPYLLKNGVRKIDAAFVTHLHEDHYGGIKSLSAEGMIDMIGVYEANRYKKAELEAELDSEILYVHKGYSFNLDDDIVLEVISPEAESENNYRSMLENEEDENKMSLIMKITYKGKTLLVTGDIDEEGERDLIKKYSSELSCDIMKVPHHGSKYSSSEEFVKVTNPALAVFQVGRNNYGHPSAEAIARYRDRGCETARNDADGAIGLIIDYGKTFEVIKMFN